MLFTYDHHFLLNVENVESAEMWKKVQQIHGPMVTFPYFRTVKNGFSIFSIFLAQVYGILCVWSDPISMEIPIMITLHKFMMCAIPF